MPIAGETWLSLEALEGRMILVGTSKQGHVCFSPIRESLENSPDAIVKDCFRLLQSHRRRKSNGVETGSLRSLRLSVWASHRRKKSDAVETLRL